MSCYFTKITTTKCQVFFFFLLNESILPTTITQMADHHCNSYIWTVLRKVHTAGFSSAVECDQIPGWDSITNGDLHHLGGGGQGGGGWEGREYNERIAMQVGRNVNTGHSFYPLIWQSLCLAYHLTKMSKFQTEWGLQRLYRINKQRGIIRLDRQGTQEQSPVWPTVTPPGQWVHTRCQECTALLPRCHQCHLV